MNHPVRILCCALLAGRAFASPAACIEAPLSNANTPEIVVAQRQAAHLEFPEPIVRPVWGDAERWQIAAYAETPTHLWITPTQLVAAGDATTLTVLTASGAFDFVVRQAEAGAPTCYRFYFEQAIGTLSVTSPVVEPQSAIGAMLPAPGRYAWKSKEIAEVRDDGRFTYVRFVSPPRRLPAITDDAGGPVNAEWQPLQLSFRIVGLFDGLRVHVGRRPVEIKRQS